MMTDMAVYPRVVPFLSMAPQQLFRSDGKRLVHSVLFSAVCSFFGFFCYFFPTLLLFPAVCPEPSIRGPTGGLMLGVRPLCESGRWLLLGCGRSETSVGQPVCNCSGHRLVPCSLPPGLSVRCRMIPVLSGDAV